MEHKDLVARLQHRLGFGRDRVEAMLEGFSHIVTERCSQMDTIMIQGLGTFEARKKMERVAVNPTTGKRMLIPPKVVLVFKPNNAIKNRLKDKKQ
ncbi:MAG: HU family DNA-binding protein [Bacteroidaceae bacterium]|nr:HU family DNA-binding protein [Bacteroidaceae bacterium]MBR6749822.1 HU family DNA-binding protein [Bacteroidaceae bacterium]